ncbi:galactose oxidase [Lentinus tigrinus ALCF2SS1-7]|uniref:Galactose oxidase n=1 Tax=Lentinus tigrinus ALCF2SS1-6 TaxID=1328759 RepID=A0A5C2RST6_9APHY|nr:galactose oxidase [Lentinus tigrinus ALCF2SS1-6]RPD73683.1 galactose oxidase [Lentinus tigrinus ALCF2SS1-7]
MATLAAYFAVLALSLPHTSHASLRRVRQAPSTPDIPGTKYEFLGCFTDQGARTLGGPTFVNTTGMTVESCVDFCSQQDFNFAGLEFAQECWCGNSIANGGTNVTETDCSFACTGNSTELCGAGNRLSVYWNGVPPPPPPITVPSVGLWDSLGCFNDSVDARVLSVGVNVPGNFSVEGCTEACFGANYPLAGVEFGAQCFCDTQIENGGAPTPLSDCNMACSGNSSEFCGGPNRLNVYNFTGTLTGTPTPPGGGNPGNPGNPVVAPVLSGLPSTWEYAACFVDNAFGRIFATQLPDDQALTVESCVASCNSRGSTLAGMEFGVQCFCGNELIDGAVKGDEDTCNMSCGGNSTEACGGPNRLSVYTSSGNVTALPVPSPLKTGLPGQWTYQGCLTDNAAGSRTFPLYQIINQTNTTIEGCLSQCSAFGYPAAGVEFGQECYCGDLADVKNHGATLAPESDCNIACTGDPIHLCGGGNRLSYYTWNGTLTDWKTPENIGRYEFLVPGVVVPLLVTLGINNKVAFLEKFGTSEFPNSTGAYELDLSLTNDFDKAWREMHVKSDVFCAGAVVLPDRSARHLVVGGWSLDSTFGVRLYAPDGSPGVNGTNDWQENFQELKLQIGRWYPSALVMSNGSVLVVGGERGSNDIPEPTLEILPTPEGGPTFLFMDWLNRTDPNNLYPFLHMLPSGNIFVGYYNEARILDPVTFDTVKTLPNMPGSVVSPLAGRTYPLEGTAVLFPQHAPYTDPLTVLVCGGSNFGIALDNCVSIQPEVENPQWTLERMPSQRVMPCMVTLPDGTFLIVNGAHQGVAGFGLATDPNLSALLYDPTQPVGSRISILNNTIVARLYHSEATLLPDGRVLISGSDPESPQFPEEMRVEVYIPPYLNQGFTQPSFTVDEKDWEYGGSYTIHVTLHQGTTANMRVSMIAATSSTHGNSMGMRTLFPEFSCNGNTCTVVAPPNSFVSPPGWWQIFVLDGPTPSHSNWVRVGGDPGQLGNWPDFPDFTLPGMGPPA